MSDILVQMMTSMLYRSVEYLRDDLGINVQFNAIESINDDVCGLIGHTSLIATTGKVETFIAMGYEKALFDHIVKVFLQGDEVAGDELVEIQESISCEIINIIVGNALVNPLDGSHLNITSPLFVNDIGSVFKDKHKSIVTAIIGTNFGTMVIGITDPRKNSLK